MFIILYKNHKGDKRMQQYSNLELFNFISGITDDLMQKATGKVAYALSYNIRKMQEELKEYLKIRDELIHKYSKELEDGQIGIDLKSKEYKDFTNDLDEYNNIVHEVNFIILNPEDLFDSELNADDMMRIEFMIGDQDEV